jgi:hypothetical protein
VPIAAFVEIVVVLFVAGNSPTSLFLFAFVCLHLLAMGRSNRLANSFVLALRTCVTKLKVSKMLRKMEERNRHTNSWIQDRLFESQT